MAVSEEEDWFASNMLIGLNFPRKINGLQQFPVMGVDREFEDIQILCVFGRLRPKVVNGG